MDDLKILLSEDRLPKRWYNALADLPTPMAPPIHPGTQKPLQPEDLAPIFPMSLIQQEMTAERWIDIPEPVREILRQWRPTPLHRARRLEQAIKTNCRIYYKNESVSPTGSHKTNTSIAQAYYNQQAGIKRLATETGAGQWGSALSYACNVFGLKCRVYMVKVSYQQKPFRRSLMHVWGSEVVASPSELTHAGREILKATPHSNGSLGIAISEAVEDAAGNADTNYALGSVLNHVLLHQTVMGLETQEQLEIAGEKADVLVGCVGGGSNFGGLILPFLPEKLKRPAMRIVAVEPSACPTLTKGVFDYDFGDTAKLTPLIKMYTLGHGFMPPGIHAGGLRYHGASPLISHLLHEKLIEARACAQTAVFEAAETFARAEGVIPAPETAHAIRATIDLAREAKEPKVIVFSLSGHGFLDLAAYDKYLANELTDYHLPAHAIEEALKELPRPSIQA